MNIEAINKWLDEEYGCSYTKLEELHNFYFEKYCDLKQENKQLKEKVDKYENPEDMTLFAMWCTEKVKEENQKLQTIANNCKQLKDNWNKLKEYIKETKLKEFEKSYGKRYGKTFTQAEIIVCNMILDKMQELEESDSNAKD